MAREEPDDWYAQLTARVAARAQSRDQVTPLFKAWLERNAGPDDWHRITMTWNWDFGLDVPAWICRQASCDRATALRAFWATQPDYYLRFGGARNAVPDCNRDAFDFAEAVRSRWRSGAYVRAELGFELDELWRPDFAALEAEFGERVAIELPPDMRGPLPGRTLEREGMIEGIPARFWPKDLR